LLERVVRRAVVVGCSPPVLVVAASVGLRLRMPELLVHGVEALAAWGTFSLAYVLLMLVPCSALCLHLVSL
jgi:hypothetical protein